MSDERDATDVAAWALGAALLSPDALHTIRRVGLAADDLRDPAHRLIYEAMIVLDDAGRPVDVVTVAEHLDGAGQLDRVGAVSNPSGLLGGPGCLLDLATATPAISNAARYATFLRDDAHRRRLRLVDEEARWKPI